MKAYTIDEIRKYLEFMEDYGDTYRYLSEKFIDEANKDKSISVLSLPIGKESTIQDIKT